MRFKSLRLAVALSLSITCLFGAANAYAHEGEDAGECTTPEVVATQPQVAPSTLVGTTFKKDGLKYEITKACSDKTGKVTVTKCTKGKKKVTIPDTISKSFQVTVDGVYASTSFTFKVTAIGDKAFYNSKGKKLQTLTIGENVTKIGDKAFYKCSKLTKISFKGKKIGQYKGKKHKGKMGKKAFAGVPRSCNAYTPTTRSLNFAYKQGTRELMTAAGFKGVVF